MPIKKLLVSTNNINGKPVFEIRPVTVKEEWMNTHTLNPILIKENALAHGDNFLFNTV